MIKCLIVFVIFLFLLPLVSASDAPNVTLVSPAGGNISTSSSVSFFCNVTDDENVFNVSLYTNTSGTFSIRNTTRIMELVKDSYTMLLCRFDNSYTCEDGESGTNASTDFVSGKAVSAVRINDSDTLTYPTPNNLYYDQGTIEFWFNPGFSPSSPPDTMYLYSTGNTGEDQIDIYVDYYGTLHFDFHDFYGYTKTASADIAEWSQGDWHHITTLWEYLVGTGDMRLDLFLDGSNGSTSVSGTYYSYGGSFGSTMYVGTSGNNQYQAYSNFDEFRISNISRTPSEINASYMKGAGNHSKESVSWTTNISDGFYKWNCLAYDNESQGSWNESNLTFYVDTSPPLADTITFYPNSTDDVDPGSTVNMTANVTDLINVSYVMLQWKETGDWENDTMDYNASAGLYENAGITFEQTGGTYYYRVWSNDTLGHSGHSPTYNITVEWDYTWSRSPSDLGTAYGVVGCPNCYVGAITVNNTGDDSLSIQMTDNWPLGIYYNVSNPFSIGPKNITHVNVTAEFSSEDSEYPVVINITASHGSETPSPLYHTVTLKINSYSGGPYFDDDDVTINSPTSAYQGMSYNLSTRLKNIGNETTTGVWINWTLPTGWSNSSGSLTQYIGNLNGTTDGGNIAFNNITVYLIPDSATAGIQSIYANASSDDNLTGNASAVVYVLCNSNDGACGAGCNYFSDDDCSAPSVGGTATTLPVLAAPESEMGIEALERFDLNRGESGVFSVYVYNTVIGTIVKSIILHISGYPQTHMKISPAIIDSLGYNEKKPFSVEINVPEYYTYGEHELVLKAEGLHANETIEADAKTVLFVHSATENETKEILDEAEKRLNEMVGMDLNTEKLSSLLEQARTVLDEWDYDKAWELGNDVVRISETALRVKDMIKNIETGIDKAGSYGMDVPETQKMYTLTVAAFQRGDYERAEERAESALLTYSVETMGLVEVLIFLHGYWWALIIIIIVLIVAFWRFHRVIIIRSISGKLKSIDIEEREILGMIRDYQKRYWQDRSISAEDYQGFLSEHEKRFTDMMKNRSDLTIRKIKLTADNVLKALERELGSVKKRMDDLQKKYFETRELPKTSYLMMMNGLGTEMTNIQKNIDMVKSGKKKPGKSGKSTLALAVSVIIIILLLSMLPHVNALGDKDRALEAIQGAEIEIQSMKELGFGTSYANDTLNEAKLLYNQEKYLAAESLAEKVTEIKSLAIETDSLIDQVEAMLYESHSLGIDTSPAEMLFNQSLEAFGIEDYIQAKDLLTQAINKLDELESEAALQKTIQKTWYSEIASFLGLNWIPLVIIIIIVLTAISLVYFTKRSKKVRERLSGLEDDKKSLEKLLKDLQVKYFRDSLISRSEYERLKNHYRKSIMEIERNLKLLKG